MLIVVSPAKALDTESPVDVDRSSEPRLLESSAELAGVMAAKAPDEHRSLMGISASLAELNFERFGEWEAEHTDQNARPALLTFDGDTFKGMDAPGTFSTRDWTHAQKTLRILSGLYGVLRPLDLIQPYRLEMGTKLITDRGRDLYQFWGNEITRCLATDVEQSPGASALVNLASNEYFGSVDPVRLGAKVISPVFLDYRGSAKPKIVSFFAKRARGAMAGWMVTERVTTISGLSEFSSLGYAFDEERSSPDAPVFIRESPPPAR